MTTRRTRILGWIAAVALVLAAVWVPDVRTQLFLLTFWVVYAMVFGSPFILACLLIWYLVRRVDRGTRRRGFDILPARRDTSDRTGDASAP